MALGESLTKINSSFAPKSRKVFSSNAQNRLFPVHDCEIPDKGKESAHKKKCRKLRPL